MKKLHIVLFIMVSLLVASAVGYVIFNFQDATEVSMPLPMINRSECATDSDCKLIYSNCDCEATTVNDPRKLIESKEVCKWNLCHGTGITAICKDSKCVKSEPINKN